MADPTNPIDIFIRLLLALIAAFFMAESTSMSPAPIPPEGTFISDTIISTVETNILESSPPQVQIVVSGQQPDGCDFPVIVAQSRQGNTVTVHIYREIPIDVMCAMVLLPYNDTITLEGTFESGSYTIVVNGVTVTLQI